MEIYRNLSNDIHRENDFPAVITDNMIQYALNGRLHRANGPAVITASGCKMYYWKGVFIEEDMFLARNTMTAAEILSIPNAEIRRCFVEMKGFAKFIKEANAKILDSNKETGAVLYKVDMPDDDSREPLVVVKVFDGTIHEDENGKPYRKEYFLRVPPKTKTCNEAIAWTFDMPEKEYRELEKET